MNNKKVESLAIEYTNGEAKVYENVVIKPTPIDNKYFTFQCGPRTFYVNTDKVNAIIVTSSN